MIELNKNKLIPGVDTAWGDIRGDISKQSDLMSMMSDYATESWVSGKNYLTASSLKTINNQSIVGSGNIEIDASVPDYYATKAWVSEQGYLTSETLPSDLATESWVSSQNFATESWVSSQSYLVSNDLSQYATRQWVTSRGYITSDALSGYATESWVISQAYITSSALSGYATESWVSSQQFATQSWVSVQGYLTSVPSGYATESWVISQAYITSSALSGYATQSWVDLQHFATQAWVSEQGYLTSESLPSDIATQSWVVSNFLSTTALSGYATEQWVSSQGFLTSSDTVVFSSPEYYSDTYPYICLSSGIIIATFYDAGGGISGYKGIGLTLNGSVGLYSYDIADNEELFDPFVTMSDYEYINEQLSSLTSRVSSIESTLGEAVTITNNILS